MSDPRLSPQATAAGLGTSFIGSGSAMTMLGMLMHSNLLLSGGVAILAVGLVFQVRSLRFS